MIKQRGRIVNILGDPNAIAIGKKSVVEGRLLTYGHGGRIRIGNHCFVGERTEIWSMSDISIGNRVLISHSCNIHDGNAHPINPTMRHEHYREIITTGHPRKDRYNIPANPVVIEDDVWLSFGVTVLKGVRIGKGSVIGAGCVVTKDVPPNMIYFNQTTPMMRPITVESDVEHAGASE